MSFRRRRNPREKLDKDWIIIAELLAGIASPIRYRSGPRPSELTKMRISTLRLSAFVANLYKSNSSPIDKESTGTAVESGALILINERAFPEM